MLDKKKHDETKNDVINDLDSFENYSQNTIASMSNVGTISVPGLVTELVLNNPNGIETKNNITEKKEKVEMLGKSSKDDKKK